MAAGFGELVGRVLEPVGEVGATGVVHVVPESSLTATQLFPPSVSDHATETTPDALAASARDRKNVPESADAPGPPGGLTMVGTAHVAPDLCDSVKA